MEAVLSISSAVPELNTASQLRPVEDGYVYISIMGLLLYFLLPTITIMVIIYIIRRIVRRRKRLKQLKEKMQIEELARIKAETAKLRKETRKIQGDKYRLSVEEMREIEEEKIRVMGMYGRWVKDRKRKVEVKRRKREELELRQLLKDQGLSEETIEDMIKTKREQSKGVEQNITIEEIPNNKLTKEDIRMIWRLGNLENKYEQRLEIEFDEKGRIV